MGLHAGFYTQHLSNQGPHFEHSHEMSPCADQSFLMKGFLKNLSNPTICSRCQLTFSPDGSLPEWLGPREEGP